MLQRELVNLKEEKKGLNEVISIIKNENTLLNNQLKEIQIMQINNEKMTE